MRIALLAPIAERVPPSGYGGIELVVSLLAEGLAAAGHDVTLFATRDSRTRARVIATQERPLRALGLPAHHCEPRVAMHLLACFERAGQFDVIHNHVGPLALAMAPFVSTPVLTTLHGPFDEHNRALFEHCRTLPYVSISNAQRCGGPALDYRATVYNGVDCASFHLAPKGSYLLHLGRICAEKGTDRAVRIARRAGMPLWLAAKVDPVDRPFYEREIAPHIDGQRVRFLGEVAGSAKADLLARARALVHPVRWPEPFGLVMAEAMASGTPVVGMPLGAVPELVEPGVTGYMADDEDGAVRALEAAMRLEPAAIRRRAAQRFDASRMVADYIRVYEGLMRPPVRVTIDARAREGHVG